MADDTTVSIDLGSLAKSPVLAALLLAVGGVAAAWIYRGGGPAPAPVPPGPAPATDYAALTLAAVGGDASGAADEYVAGLLSGLADKIGPLTTGKQVAALVASLAQVGGVGEPPIDFSGLASAVGFAGVPPGPLDTATKADLIANLKAAAAAAEAL